MNQLQIDISFNYNDSIEITSNISYNLNLIQKKNNFLKLNVINIDVNNEKIFDEEKIEIPINFKINGETEQKMLELKVKCFEDDDISKNKIINLNFGYTFNLDINNLGNINNELIPDEISECDLSKLNLLENNLPEDILEWKKNKFTTKPFYETKLDNNDGDIFFYCWIIPYNICFNTNCTFNAHSICYYGDKLEIPKINLWSVLTLVNRKISYEDVKLLY